MKKSIFSVLIVLVLLWSCGVVFGQRKGRRGGPEKEKEQTEVVEKEEGQEADTYEPDARAKRKQARKQKEFDMQGEEWRKKREMRLKGKEKSEVVKGKDIEQQLAALQKQIAHEEAKHNKRLARLQRMQELAGKTGKTDIADKVNRLLQKEEQRYGRKKRVLERHERMLSMGRGRKGQGPREKSLEKEGERDIKKRSYEDKYKGKGGSGDKKTEE